MHRVFSPLFRRVLLLAGTVVFLPTLSHAVTISSLTANKTTISKYDKYELKFDLTNVSPSNFNPFRPDTTGDSLSPAGVDVWAEVTTPSGTARKVWGFWDIDYAYLGNLTKATQENHDRFVPTSAPHWHVRFAPMETGRYTVVVKAKDQSGTASSSQMTFDCVESSGKGFIKMSADGSRMVYSDGSPFVPFGMQATYGTHNIAPTMDLMKANGMNFIRRWLTNRTLDDIHRDLEGWSMTADTGTYRSGKQSATKSVSGAVTIADLSFIGCKPNTYYKASVYIKTSSSFNGTAAVTVDEDGSNMSKIARVGNTVGSNRNWSLSQVVFRTGANAEVLHFKPKVLNGSSGAVWVDDASLYECDSAGNVTVDCNMVFNPGYEKWNPTQLRMIALARVEYLLQKAEEAGVVVQPCIFDYRLWNSTSPTGFYRQFYNDWWSDATCIAQQDRVLRYLVARFSAYRSVFAWELTNEMDSSYHPVRGDWIAGRANFIRSGDLQGHPITNSYWSSPADEEYGQMKELDINQVHYYMNTEEYSKGRGYPGWWILPSGMTIDTNASNAASGNCSLKVTANGSTISRNAGIYCRSSRSFTLRYKVKTSGVSGQASVVLKFFGGSSPGSTVTVNNTGTTSGYVQRTQDFTTGSTCTHFDVTVQMTGSSGTAWFDDFEVIDNTTKRQMLPNAGFESLLWGDDEFDWAVYGYVNPEQRYNSGPNGKLKAFASGEFGLMGPTYDLSYWARYGDTTKPRHDSQGMHLHNALWAQLCVSSALNTPTYWWVGDYIEPWKLHHIWKGATTFAANLPFYDRKQAVSTDSCVSDVKVTVSDPRLRIVGQKSENSGYFWIQNKENIWSRVIREGRDPTPASGTIGIPGFANGTYSLKWYNTYTGQSTDAIQSVTDGVLRLSVSSLSTDTAVIVRSSAVTGSPQVSLTLTADKGQASPGDTITYTIAYTNTGNAVATDVHILLPIPAHTVAGTISNGGAYDASAQVIRWIIPTLAAGASGQCTAQVKVN